MFCISIRRRHSGVYVNLAALSALLTLGPLCNAVPEAALLPPPHPHYTLTDLGAVSGYANSRAYSINRQGQIVGQGATLTPQVKTQALLWDGGKVRPISVPQSVLYGVANGINARGQAVGGSEIHNYGSHGFDFPHVDQGYIWQDGQVTLLDRTSHAYGINDSGTIAGVADAHAVLWMRQEMTRLTTPPGTTGSVAYAVNAAGEAVGDVSSSDWPHQACLWRTGQMQTLGALIGDTASIARAINASGQIVGSSGKAPEYAQHPFLWQGGTMRALPVPLDSWQAEALGLNAQGQAVGYGLVRGAYMHALLWQNNKFYDLNDFVPFRNPLVLMKAWAINDRGQIVGEARDAALHIHAFLLTPAAVREATVRRATRVSAVPELSSLTLDSHSKALNPGLNALAISADARLVAGVAYGDQQSGKVSHGEVHLWNASTGVLQRSFLTDGGAVGVAFSQDGKTLAVALATNRDAEAAQGSINLWDAASGALRRRIVLPDGQPQSLVVSAQGYIACIVSKVRQNRTCADEVRLWDSASGRLIRSLPVTGNDVQQISFTADGKTLMGEVFLSARASSAPGDERIGTAPSYTETRFWDVATGRLRRTLSADRYADDPMAVSPDGKLLARQTFCPDGTPDDPRREVQVFDISTGSLLRVLPLANDVLGALAFSPDGYRLAGGGKAQRVSVWNLATGRKTHTLGGLTKYVVTRMDFGPEGTLVAAGDSEGKASLWHLDAPSHRSNTGQVKFHH